MKTRTYQEIMNQAAEDAGRTRDRIPQSEQLMLQGFVALKLRSVWNLCVWSDLISGPLEVAVADHQFSKNEGAQAPAIELGDVLGYYTRAPHKLDDVPRFDFQETSNTVWVDTHDGNVWVLYMPPVPDLMALAGAALLAATLPEELANYLSAVAGYKLAVADQNYGLAQMLKADAQEELVAAQNRNWDKLPLWLKRPRMQHRRRHWPGHVPGFCPVAG